MRCASACRGRTEWCTLGCHAESENCEGNEREEVNDVGRPNINCGPCSPDLCTGIGGGLGDDVDGAPRTLPSTRI
jgi:hypothetical protein